RSCRQFHAVCLAHNGILGNTQLFSDYGSRVSGLPKLAQFFNAFWRPGHRLLPHVEVISHLAHYIQTPYGSLAVDYNILWTTSPRSIGLAQLASRTAEQCSGAQAGLLPPRIMV